METDYLIVGAGGMGMAFADVILTETDAHMVIVDKHDRPGGHWNDAYPFVRLHQPSSFYGVNSRHLGGDTKDQHGWNKGLYELAPASEVCTYFDQVMQRQFIPSGRVKYFPMHDYRGDGRICSMTTGKEVQVTHVRERLVDATYMNVNVPSVRGPQFDVDGGVRCIPPNDLTRISHPVERYVVIGGGKTGMDSCLWLLAKNVDPENIVWIIPRDSWINDRANVQFGSEFYEQTLRSRAQVFEAAAQAQSLDDLFLRLEACGQLLRLDKAVWPTMYRCATVTRAELEQLQRLKNIVRRGRVTRLGLDEIVLDQGAIATSPGTLHIDCTADGLPQRPPKPVFDGDTITLQTVRPCQQTFSAAFIAHIEASVENDEARNEYCRVITNPDTSFDWLQVNYAMMLNQRQWAANDEIRDWLSNCRLDFIGRATAEKPQETVETAELLRRAGDHVGAAMANMKALLAESEGATGA